MGTRADFYVGRGESAEWLGSIAWDGYPSGIDYQDVLRPADEELDGRDDCDEWNDDNKERLTFPDMTAIQSVDFGARSGVIILSVPQKD